MKKVCIKIDGIKSSYSPKDWWWEDSLLCLVFDNGKRHYFTRNSIEELEIENVKTK